MKKPDFSISVQHLSKHPRFKKLVKAHGHPDISDYFPKVGGVFGSIVRSITYQQISGKAAGAIYARFAKLFPRKAPTPERLLKLTDGELRACGYSTQKIAYLRDAARKFADGTINPRRFPKMTSEKIIEHFVQIKGVGTWTAHMVLIFTLHRLDILPTGDLGIRKGFQKVYGLKSLPSHAEMEKLAQEWRTHASIASWYLWREADG
jgi:DNA-3-methyladenine glycosylase II